MVIRDIYQTRNSNSMSKTFYQRHICDSQHKEVQHRSHIFSGLAYRKHAPLKKTLEEPSRGLSKQLEDESIYTIRINGETRDSREFVEPRDFYQLD